MIGADCFRPLDTMPPHPSGSAAALRERFGPRYRWLLLVSVVAGNIAALLPSTGVNVAVPAMSLFFGLGQERAQWITSSFMVASTVAMLTTPWLLGRFGYRRTFAGAMGLLMAGALLGGLAQQFGLLLLARVAEGVAAGIIQPIPAIIILYAFQPHEQGKANGLFGMGIVLAPAIAPALAGLLVDAMGWRSTFFMVLPPSLLSLWLAWRYVPTNAPGGSQPGQAGALDWVGLTLVVASTLSLLNSLVAFHHSTPLAALLLAVSAGCLWVFLRWQRRLLAQGRKPLVDLRLFGVRSFAMGCIVAFVYGAAMFGSTYLLPLFIQMGMGLSAGWSGNLLLPAGLVLALTIPWGGRLADRRPTHWLVGGGTALLALSFALMLLVDAHTSLWVLAGFIIIGRIGLGFVLPSLNLGAMRPLEKALIAQGSSAISFVRMLGGAVGVGVSGIALEWRLAVQASPPASVEAGRILAFHECFAMLTVMCLLAVAAASQLRSTPPPQVR